MVQVILRLAITFLIAYIQTIRCNEKCVLLSRNTLCDPEVIRYINIHTLFWACNVKSGEGYKVAEALKSGSYPFLALIVLKDNRMTIVGRYVRLIYLHTSLKQTFMYLFNIHNLIDINLFFSLTDQKAHHLLLIYCRDCKRSQNVMKLI